MDLSRTRSVAHYQSEDQRLESGPQLLELVKFQNNRPIRVWIRKEVENGFIVRWYLLIYEAGSRWMVFTFNGNSTTIEFRDQERLRVPEGSDLSLLYALGRFILLEKISNFEKIMLTNPDIFKK